MSNYKTRRKKLSRYQESLLLNLLEEQLKAEHTIAEMNFDAGGISTLCKIAKKYNIKTDDVGCENYIDFETWHKHYNKEK